jgi:hypothetical protein
MEFSKPLLKSIEHLQYQATPGELAAQSGLPLLEVERDLQQLAIAVGGHLQVSTTGEIVYKYPSDLEGILRKKFLWLQVQTVLEGIWRVIFYLIRLSFGICLIGIAVLVTLALFLIALGLSSNDSGGEGIGEVFVSGGSNAGCGESFWIFDWNTTSEPLRDAKTGKKRKLSFMGAVFSFLFGDGNPNAKLEEQRWKIIGQAIRKQRGVVTAEQMAPYLEDATAHSEDHMMPVLLRFNGLPEVSPIGDVVYRFPDLQTVSQAQKFKRVPQFLEEKLWKFSLASPGQKAWVVALAAFNVAGTLAIGLFLKGKAVGLLALVAYLYWPMLLYATGFAVIPLCRWLWLQWANQRIHRRNQRRRQWLGLLNSQDVERKLLFADEFRSELVIEEGDIVYGTEEDLLDQEIDGLAQLEADSSSDRADRLPPKH